MSLKQAQNQANPSTMPLTTKDYLEVIQTRAQERWGKKWLSQITEAYVRLQQQRGDDSATFLSRRSQIRRAFDQRSCSTETLFLLAEAVSCEFQMICTEVKIIR